MSVFVDTSAIYALLNPLDERHADAQAILAQVSDEPLLTSNYVLVETAALVLRRMGRSALRALDLLASGLRVAWVDESLHQQAWGALLAAGRSSSIVDQVSFALMRRERITQAFAFDDDFAQHGFVLRSA